jgi:hypothetical protein
MTLILSADIETNGPTPLVNAMLSFGCAMMNMDGKVVATFSRNLIPPENSKPDPATVSEFWDKNPEALAAVSENRVPLADAMRDWLDWLAPFRATDRVTLAAWPLLFDGVWLQSACAATLGIVPFKHSEGLCIKSLAAGVLGKPFERIGKRDLPKRWFAGAPRHDHVALTDAIGQGILLVNILRENAGLRPASEIADDDSKGAEKKIDSPPPRKADDPSSLRR